MTLTSDYRHWTDAVDQVVSGLTATKQRMVWFDNANHIYGLGISGPAPTLGGSMDDTRSGMEGCQ
jgi:hypothetical protein